jgi:outer membrane receptor protein involved in Fe transport
MPRYVTAFVAVVFLSVIAPALAGTNGIVRGVVSLSGAPANSVTVTLAGEGQQFTTTTDSRGEYHFDNVPFGHYTITATSPGAATRTEQLDVTSGSVATINVDLLRQIALTTATAHGGASGTPVAVSQIDRAQIQTSPVRDSLNQLIETLPGVVQFSYNEPVIDGFHGVTYEIDGAPLPLATTSNFSEIVDPRDIDSLEVYTGAIPAEYGGQRMGGVVNILTDRFANIPEGAFGTITGGIGSQAQAEGRLDEEARFGNSEVFLNVNSERTNWGLDAPTLVPEHDASSQSDEFLRYILQINPRDTLAFDYSNQLSQFQIPINTNPNDPNDPIVAAPGTNDLQFEYDRFANLNFTATSKDGNGVFQVIPWWRSTRINYDGDLANDVLGIAPNFGCVNSPGGCAAAGQPDTVNNVGLVSNSDASYAGLRVNDFRAGRIHSWKVGVDIDRENSTASQTYACFYEQCALPGVSTIPIVRAVPYFSASTSQAAPGSNTGIYAEDQWQAAKDVVFNYGVRYDHSTGYTTGNMIEPRIGVNLADGGKNVYHIFYGRYYAAPTLEDVRQACTIFAAQSGCATTTPVYDLQPERDAYFELGLRHDFNTNLTGWVDLFRKNVVNVLDTTQLLNTPLFAVYNNAIGVDTGLDIRLQERTLRGDNWFFTSTISGSYAGGISGSTFLFPPNINAGLPLTSGAQLAVEDHDQTVDSTGGYTHYFGANRSWFASLQADYGSGFPVQFQNANFLLSGRLPAHTTFDLSTGRIVLPGRGPNSQGLGVTLDVDNLLNHQYVIKVANGFNTTQVANGRTVLLRLTAPF